MRECEKSTLTDTLAGGSSSPGNCGLTLAHQNLCYHAALFQPIHRSSGVSTAAASLINSKICGRRLIMPDGANNNEERMDERSGRGTGGSSNMSGTSATMNSTRSDSGVENRNTGTVTRKTPRGFA